MQEETRMMTWQEYDAAVEYHREQIRKAAHEQIVHSLSLGRRTPTPLVRLAGNALYAFGSWLVATGNRLQTEPATVAERTSVAECAGAESIPW